jgi:Fe-S cluster biogenesis protein NfuA
MTDMDSVSPQLILIQDVLDTLRPAMRADGGDVELVDFERGLVRVRLCGTCIACPSKNLTLKLGIERTLKSRLPWVVEVVRVE